MAFPDPESIADATAYWLYTEDEGWERWRLVPGSGATGSRHTPGAGGLGR